MIEQIAGIEALAEERLQAGTAYHSVHVGALALLKLALEEIDGMSPPIRACTPTAKQTRCNPPEG